MAPSLPPAGQVFSGPCDGSLFLCSACICLLLRKHISFSVETFSPTSQCMSSGGIEVRGERGIHSIPLDSLNGPGTSVWWGWECSPVRPTPRNLQGTIGRRFYFLWRYRAGRMWGWNLSYPPLLGGKGTCLRIMPIQKKTGEGWRQQTSNSIV